MWCMLLLQKPDTPAVAGRMRSEEPVGVPAAQVPYPDQRWTYGYRLIANDREGLEYRNRFTPELCQTIAKCMMARQEHRPDLTQLQTDITNALGAAPPPLPAWVREFFGRDNPPRVPARAMYTDVDLENMDPFNPYPADNDDNLVDPPTPPRRRRTRKAPLEELTYQN